MVVDAVRLGFGRDEAEGPVLSRQYMEVWTDLISTAVPAMICLPSPAGVTGGSRQVR
jgi:hypothetical protein